MQDLSPFRKFLFSDGFIFEKKKKNENLFWEVWEVLFLWLMMSLNVLETLVFKAAH